MHIDVIFTMLVAEGILKGGTERNMFKIDREFQQSRLSKTDNRGSDCVKGEV